MTRFLTVSNAVLNKFQIAAYAAKHARRTNRTLLAHYLDTDKFYNLRAQQEIKDKARKAKPTLPAGLTLENDIRVDKTFESIMEHLG